MDEPREREGRGGGEKLAGAVDVEVAAVLVAAGGVADDEGARAGEGAREGGGLAGDDVERADLDALGDRSFGPCPRARGRKDRSRERAGEGPAEEAGPDDRDRARELRAQNDTPAPARRLRRVMKYVGQTKPGAQPP